MKIHFLILTILTIMFSGPVQAVKSEVDIWQGKVRALEIEIAVVNKEIYEFEKSYQNRLVSIRASVQKSDTPNLQSARKLEEHRVALLTTLMLTRSLLIERKKQIDSNIEAKQKIKDEIVSVMQQMYTRSKDVSTRFELYKTNIVSTKRAVPRYNDEYEMSERITLIGTNLNFAGEFDTNAFEKVESSEPKNLLGPTRRYPVPGVFSIKAMRP